MWQNSYPELLLSKNAREVLFSHTYVETKDRKRRQTWTTRGKTMWTADTFRLKNQWLMSSLWPNLFSSRNLWWKFTFGLGDKSAHVHSLLGALFTLCPLSLLGLGSLSRVVFWKTGPQCRICTNLVLEGLESIHIMEVGIKGREEVC